ncbi:UNVERIFIED_CONTAM: hypothetical protein GTU68_003623 [Idotea baltica]|nr:hypothetical protein [Idotea baltica]
MLIKRYQNDPLTYEVEEQVGDIGDVEHSWYLVQPVDRIPHAIAVLQRYESSIVFCRTRRGCDRVAKVFASKGLSAVAIHGDRSQHQRERALSDFTSGKAQVLVATDVAARGIHVDNVALVMHYDPAGSDKDYIHRSGRTGRAGQDGRVISMVVEDKKKTARQLQKDLGLKPGLEVLDVSSLGPIVKPPKPAPAKPSEPKERDDRFDDSRGRNRNDRDDGEGRGKHRNDRDKNRGGRNRNDRDGRGRDSRGGRNRNDRDDRSQRGEGGNRGSRSDNDGRRGRGNDERRPDGKRKGFRRGANDWYPPGFHDDKRDDDRGGDSRRRTSSPGRTRGDANKRDDERTERPVGGRNSTKRKNRSDKGRHADKASSKNKGKGKNAGSSKNAGKGKNAAKHKGANPNKGKRRPPR